MESGFSTTDFEVICATDFSCAKLLKSVDYVARDGMRYRAPYMAATDFASVPDEFWGAPLFLIPTGWYALPALFHDCAYRNDLLKESGADLSSGGWVTANLMKQQCDDLLCEMMQAIKPAPTDLERLQMQAIHQGLVLGGWHAFRSDRE
jgi:Protein of unknown function (DUF1353)